MIRIVRLIFAAAILLAAVSCGSRRIIITYDSAAAGQVELAAAELQRYIYLRTGNLPLIREGAASGRGVINLEAGAVQGADTAAQRYFLKSQSDGGLLIRGASPVAVLYGVYDFIGQALGVAFELQGDIFPDQPLKDVMLEGYDQSHTPAFALRGIQPFHDFPEGPDYWTLQDYRMIVTQLTKMRMNFIGFHTYPEKVPYGGWERAEPTVWIGMEDDFKDDGTVTAAYPALHANTGTYTWEYEAVPTSQFHFGARHLYECDVYGTDFMKNRSPWPHTEAENIEIFNSMGTILRETFALGRMLGVKSCIGTEIPMTIPLDVKARLRGRGLNPESAEARKAVYKGTFARIAAMHPLDYYWFWTPEPWTWQGENWAQVAAVETDFRIAQAAAEELQSPFQLATCGWVLGPSHDRTAFDRLLPKSWPFSCINREQGFTPVEPGFSTISGRPKWQISWIEDDPALVAPQLWAGRVRKDAVDAYRYRCNGLMGIHWRTMELSPTFRALAQAGWDAGQYTIPVSENERDYPVDDLYLDWAKSWFGAEMADSVAAIFCSKDGGPLYRAGQNARRGHLARPAEWGEKGPGTIVVNRRPWSEVEKEEYAFVEKLERLSPGIVGDGNRARYDYWLNTFRYMRTMSKIGCMLGELEELLDRAERDSSQKDETAILSLLRSLTEEWGCMVTLLLQRVHTPGELGMVSNLEQHNLTAARVLSKYDDRLRALGILPEPLKLSDAYTGVERIVVTTRESILRRDEPLRLRAAILSDNAIGQVRVSYRLFGERDYRTTELTCVGSSVYEGSLSAELTGNKPFEYHYEATVGGRVLTTQKDNPLGHLSVIYY